MLRIFDDHKVDQGFFLEFEIKGFVPSSSIVPSYVTLSSGTPWIIVALYKYDVKLR